ncbi:MAG: ABC transporter substrate-binding protein [Caldilineaceae bacterium]
MSFATATTTTCFNRRQFLSITGGASVAFLLAACAPAVAPTTTTDSAAAPAAASAPQRGGTLLAEAGYADGLEVTLYTADLRPGMVASAIAFQEMVKAAGITVQIEQVPGSNYWSEHWMQSALTVSNWSVFPSADTILSLAYHSTGAWNESGINNAELDGLIEAGRAESDPAKRTEIYTQVQQIIQTEGGTLVPYFRPSFYDRSAKAQGVNYIPQGPVYFHEAWLAAE